MLRRLPTVVFAVVWVLTWIALQWSVVRFRVAIVVVLCAAVLGLAHWLWHDSDVRLTPGVVGAALTTAALATMTVPLFTYVEGAPNLAARLVLAGVAVLGVALLATGLRVHRWAVTVAAVGAGAAYLVVTAIAVIADPHPKIDVWTTLQQAADGIARGDNPYAMTWQDSPGVQDLFTYLPWTAVLLAPGRWVVGDVRWMLAVWIVVAAVLMWLLAGSRRRWVGASVIALVLLAPGTLTQIDQAWTEPLLLALVAMWAVLVARGHAWWAVIPLALACASKQHIVLFLPVLLLWRPFGVRRSVATGVLAGGLIAPWFVMSPTDFVHDTVTALVQFHPIRFANTLYLLALNEFGITLPFWVTGSVMVATIGGVTWFVWRRSVSLSVLLRCLALVLLVINLVNKQAFYNQYWLVGALVALSFAAPATRSVAAAADHVGGDPAEISSSRRRHRATSSAASTPSS